MNIHELMESRYKLAKVYAEDGAFHSASRILGELSIEISERAHKMDFGIEEPVNTKE